MGGGVLQCSETSTLPSKKFRVRDLAYIAGLLDGEGTVSGAQSNGRNYVYIQIANSNKEVLEWVQSLLGGTIIARDNGRTYPAHWKPVWKWKCPSRDTIPFLKLMVPFLKIKRKQLYMGMAIRACIEKKSSSERIGRMIKKLQAMNA